MKVLRPKEIKIYLILTTIALFVGGYFDLVRGGTTVSAFLLATAYCVGVPLCIWVRGDTEPQAKDDYPPSYGPAAIVTLVVLALYVATMAPSTAMWDTSEYIAAAYAFGLPHPPGNPFFVIIGRVFSLLPVAPNVAARVNVLAAICSAVSAGVWFLIAEQVLWRWLPMRWLRWTGGALAVLIGATAFTVWTQSVVNEKVYTVSLIGIALVSWLAVRWSAHPDGPRADRRLVMIAYLLGLGYANHMAGMLPAPAVAAVVLLCRPVTLLRWRLLLACLAFVVLGVTPFATQPIRAAYHPALNEGEPTACRTKLEWSCTFSRGTYDAFMYNFNRGQYGKPKLSERQATLGEQVGMWWLYFRWQWFRDADVKHPTVQAELAAVFLVLGLLGGVIHFQRDRRSFWYFGPLMFTMTLALIYYLNFKLGASQDPRSPSPHEVRDRDYFYLWSYSAWGVWAALGLTWVWETLASFMGVGRSEKSEHTIVGRAFAYSSPVLLLAILPLAANWTSASRAHHRATRNIAVDLLNSVEPYGVLVTVGDNDTFPLWYAQEVEGIRKDVVVACTSLLNTDWYTRQLISRPIYDYDEAKGPAIYRGQHWIKPTTVPLHMTFADADAVPAYYPSDRPVPVSLGEINTVVDPSKLENGVILRADALVLRMIQDSWPARPFYFGRTSGGYTHALGLGNNVLTQGLAAKLFIPPRTATRDTAFFQGDGWFDVARTRALWNDVFHGHDAIIDEGHWVDEPSINMTSLYLFAGLELSDALRAAGDSTEARKVIDKTKKIAHIAHYDDLVRNLDAPPVAAPSDSSGLPLTSVPRGQPQVKSNDPVMPIRQ